MDLLSNPFVYRGSKIYVSTTEAGESPDSESVESELMRLQFITKTLPTKAQCLPGAAPGQLAGGFARAGSPIAPLAWALSSRSERTGAPINLMGTATCQPTRSMPQTTSKRPGFSSGFV